jgi:hypothetical protein
MPLSDQSKIEAVPQIIFISEIQITAPLWCSQSVSDDYDDKIFLYISFTRDTTNQWQNNI